MKAACRYIKSNREIIAIYGMLLAFIALSVILNNDFLSERNLKNIFTTNMPFMIAAYAQTLAILVGGVDLSIGAGISLVTCICATCATGTSVWGFLPAALLGIFLMAFRGALNGFLITKCNIQPLICTLCVSLVVAGCALAVLGMPGGKIAKEIAKPATTFEALLCLFIFLTVVIYILLNKTKLGKSIYAVGGNKQSAFSAGISTDKITIITFIISGVLSAIAGIVLAFQMRSGDPNSGEALTLKTLTASVMGGASFSGGKGNILGTFAGVMIFAIINNILNLIGISTFYQYVAQGVLLIIAITITSRRG